MHDLAICIFASGPNCLPEGGKDLVASIDKNIGISDYKYVVYAGSEKLKRAYEEAVQPGKREKIVVSKDRYAVQYNRFVDGCKGRYRYMIYSHDDVVLDSPDTFPRTMDVISGKKGIGWVTYTNTKFTSSGHLTPTSVRIGVHSDRPQYPRVFECHTGDVKNLDYPKGPVRVYGPFSHFNLISLDAMAKVGPCVDWSPTPLLTDEDWCLASCTRNFVNVWIPDLLYKHPTMGRKRVADSLRCEQSVFPKFAAKWGCDPRFTSASIAGLVSRHPQLKMFTQKSYDWMYL